LLDDLKALERIPAYAEDGKKRLVAVNRELRSYIQRPVCFVGTTQARSASDERTEKVVIVFESEPAVGQRYREQQAVAAIVQLAERGLFSRLRRCQYKACRKWVLAWREDQRFCPGGVCKKAYERASPEYAEYQKIYQRESRKRERDKQRKAKIGAYRK